MTFLSLARWLGAASLLAACSSASGSSSAGASGEDGGTSLYGLCSAGGGTPEASLGMFVSGVFGFTLPVPAGQTQQITLTVLNSGGAPATQMTDLTPQSSTLAYVGGTYPGTGGTCGDELAAGASCTLDITLVGPAMGQQTSLVILQYYDGVVFTTDTHEVEAVAVTGTFAPAPHAALPQMPQNGGQAPLSKINLVTVSFADTPEVSQIEAFGSWLVTSSYWLTVGKDYGVGAGTHTHVKLTDATPDTVIDHDFAAYVDGKVGAGELPGTAQSVYMFFFSTAVTTTDQAGAGGWHNRSAGGHDYAVILPGCSPAPGDILDQYTFVAGHEAIESATDPSPLSGYDFGFGEGEVADLCDVTTVQDGYDVPTIWSNSAAAKGGSPCIPASSLPYIDVDPSMPHVSIASSAGASAELTLTGWSTAVTGDWLLQVAVVGQNAQAFTATLDSPTDLINNGGTAKLTVTTDGSAGAGSTAIIEVQSYAPSGALASIAGVQLIPLTVTSP
jgi:hypothetical protein